MVAGMTTTGNHEFNEQLESVEASACADMFAAGGMVVRKVEGVTVLSAPAIPNPDMNRVIGLGASGRATMEQMEQVIAAYPPPLPFFLQVIQECRPPELHHWIAERGFTRKRRWVKVWRDDSPLEPRPEPPGMSDAARVDPVASDDHERFARAICEGFRLPPEAAAMVAPLVGRPGWCTYLAFVGESVAGAAMMHLGDGTAHMSMGCTLPDFRRRGIQGRLLERRITDAREAGARVMVSEAAEDIAEKPNPSLHNLLRLGFRQAYLRENYQRD